MAVIGNKLYSQTQTKQEDAARLDHQIARIEDDIHKLKIDFDIYFNGSGKARCSKPAHGSNRTSNASPTPAT